MGVKLNEIGVPIFVPDTAVDPDSLDDATNPQSIVVVDEDGIVKKASVEDVIPEVPPAVVPFNPLQRVSTLVVPVAADFGTWVNQGSSTITELADALSLATPASGDNVRSRVRTLPAAPWTVMIGCIRGFPRKDYIAGGLVLRESATSKMVILEHGYGNGGLGIASVSWTNNTSFNTAIFKNDQPAGHAFFRAARTGSNIQLSMSYDGVMWFNMGAAFALTDYFTTAPDQWGIALNGNNSATPNIDARLDVFHWSEA